MKKTIISLLVISFLAACNKDKDTKDQTKPQIEAAADDFPVQCTTLKRGDTFIFTATFSDNMELGSYGLDIHNNFDHHNHSTEVETCEAAPVKDPVNPFVLLESYPIPAGQKTFKAEQSIAIPADIDTGDYHFLIKVTDKAGWQSLKGLSIKIVD